MISRYNAHGLVWIDLLAPSAEEIALVTEQFNLPSLASQEMSTYSMSSKLDLYSKFIYLILHFPIFQSKSVEMEQEIDFVIGQDFMITIHNDPIESIIEFAKLFEKNNLVENITPQNNGGVIFAQLIKILYERSFKQLEENAIVLKQIEHQIFSARKSHVVFELSRVSRRLLDFKRSLHPHHDVLNYYEVASQKLFGEEYFHLAQRIMTKYKRVTNVLETQREILNDLQKTNDSLIYSRSNEIMKNFTIMTFVMLPMTLISGIFGMNTISNLIFIRSISDFYLVLGGMFLIGILMFIFFKSRHWI